jgi:hypothetical protein
MPICGRTAADRNFDDFTASGAEPKMLRQLLGLES